LYLKPSYKKILTKFITFFKKTKKGEL
jgi:hypothetical protein